MKGLLLLPQLEMATTKQVADFYEVPLKTVESLVKYHKDEFESDGCMLYRRNEVIDGLNIEVTGLENLVGKSIVTLPDGSKVLVPNEVYAYSQNVQFYVLACCYVIRKLRKKLEHNC